MKRSRFEVAYQHGAWYVEDLQTGEKEFYATRIMALSMGITTARGEAPSSLYIKNRAGQYVEERTYGGIDPFPPKG